MLDTNSLQVELEELKQTDVKAYEYVVERSRVKTNESALATIGTNATWLWKHPKKELLNELAETLKVSRIDQAKIRYDELLPKAVGTIEALLDSSDDRVRLQAAQGIINKMWPEKQESMAVLFGVGVRGLDDLISDAYAKRQERLQTGAGDVIDGECQDAPNV
jgi:hypothetical protein